METMGANLGADEEKDGANLENVEAFLDQLSKAAAGAEDCSGGEGGEGGEGGDVETGEIPPASEGSSGGAHKPVEWKEVQGR